MIRSLHFSRSFDRQLDLLSRSGKKAELAVAQCEKVIALLRCAGPLSDDLLIKRTKNGEYRLKNCTKYDLGGGYRLVTVREDDRLYLLFIGTHDETNLWIEHQKQEKCELAQITCRDEFVSPPRGDAQIAEENSGYLETGDDPYEAQLLGRLNESVLKTVFHALYQKPS